MASQRTDSDDDLDEFTCHSEMPAPKTDNSSNQGNDYEYISLRRKLFIAS